MRLPVLPIIACLVIAILISPPVLAQETQERGSRAAAASTPLAPEPSSTTGRGRPTTPADDSVPTRGSIPGEKVLNLPNATDDEIAEATGVYNNCAIGGEKDFFDCDCMSLAFLQRRIIDRVMQKDSGLVNINNDIRKACPNPVAIAGRSYTTCMGWAPQMRDDYEEFCECYSKAYAENFRKNPAVTLSSHKYLMVSSLNSCNAGGPVVARMTRNKRMEELKKQGLYEQLFPSAKDLPQPIDTQSAKTGSAQISPSQRITDRLFDQSTPRDMPQE